MRGISGLGRLADSSDLAISIVDEASHEISVFNNNSICQNLNPDRGFDTQCAAFCGTAFTKATKTGQPVSFTCHAGLECLALSVKVSDKPLVAIVGRTFTKAENYRKATERAISGDWDAYSPEELFQNVLLTSSSAVLDQTAADVVILMAEANPELEDKGEAAASETKLLVPVEQNDMEALLNIAKYNADPGYDPNTGRHGAILELKTQEKANKTEQGGKANNGTKRREQRTEQARAWRSFFGSLLKTDYVQAVDSILEFIARKHNFSTLIWLDKKDNRLENRSVYGKMNGRKVRLSIASDDARLIDASQKGLPLELKERAENPASENRRTMYLFPIGVSGHVSSAVAVLDPIGNDGIKKQITRICNSLAPQMEILRLRSEVSKGETIAAAVRRFSESLKRTDGEDLWLNLLQNAAELLGAERASLLIFNKKTENLEIKSLIGARSEPLDDETVGERVSKIVFETGEPIAVSDISKTVLPPLPPGRRYKTSSFLSCPISIAGQAIGVINFTDKPFGETFDKHSLEIFQTIAPQLAVAIDRASLKEKAGEFEQLSVTDALTGLLNRRYIEERLTEEVKRSNRHALPMSFMMIDVDFFKSYNDEFGHPAGDEALKIVANVVRETLRGADVAARFGGEEFVILLPQTNGDEAVAIAERIRSNIEETKFPQRRVTISIGIASCSADLCSTETIVAAADEALYEAKHRGRNRVLAFEEIKLASQSTVS